MEKITATMPGHPPYYVSLIQVTNKGVEIGWTKNPDRAIEVSFLAAQVLEPYIFRSYKEVFGNV